MRVRTEVRIVLGIITACTARFGSELFPVTNDITVKLNEVEPWATFDRMIVRVRVFLRKPAVGSSGTDVS